MTNSDAKQTFTILYIAGNVTIWKLTLLVFCLLLYSSMTVVIPSGTYLSARELLSVLPLEIIHMICLTGLVTKDLSPCTLAYYAWADLL